MRRLVAVLLVAVVGTLAARAGVVRRATAALRRRFGDTSAAEDGLYVSQGVVRAGPAPPTE